MAKVNSVVSSLTITLEADEVQFMIDVMSRIGGDPDKSWRRFADAIDHALREASGFDFDDGNDRYNGSIVVRDDAMVAKLRTGKLDLGNTDTDD